MYSFIDKNICFRSLFFVKIATMFKLLVILFIIKLYARSDIFKECIKCIILKVLKNISQIERASCIEELHKLK